MAPNLIIAAAIPMTKNDASLLTRTDSQVTKRQESSGVLSGPCDNEGVFNCIEGTTIQQCASGKWSTAKPVAKGTSCKAGQSTDPDISATGSQKRQDTAGALSGPCDNEGVFNCIAGTTIQQCASGKWSTAKPVAKGTTCKPGQSTDPDISATESQKRQDDAGALSGACDNDGIFNCIDGASLQKCASGQWSQPSPVAPGTSCTVGQSSDPGITATGSEKRQDAPAGPQIGPCDTEGIYNCIGGTSFQRCASGQWSATLSVAPGTACRVGQSQDLGITALAKAPPAKRQEASGALSGACETENLFNCIDGATFQQCASGEWTAARPVSDGTTCRVGQSEDLGISSSS